MQSLQFIKRCMSLGDQKGLYDYYAGVLQGRIDTDQRQRVSSIYCSSPKSMPMHKPRL